MAVSKIVYDGRALIDLTADTVTADALLSGTTAHDKAGNAITGALTFAAKDTLDIAGYPTRAGSPVLQNAPEATAHAR